MSDSETIKAESIKDLKQKSLSGIGSLLQRQMFVYSLSFIGNIALARMLAPDIFGIYAIVAFVVQFFSTFSDVGIGAAVIQRKERLGTKELSTLFWLQQMMALVVLALAFLAAPLALQLYPSLPPVSVWLIRGMAISFVLASLKTIPLVQLEKELVFNKIAWVDIAETITFQTTAITLALLDFGAWSFIVAAICQGLVGVTTIYTLSPWRPAFLYQFDSIKSLLRFGLPFQGNQILNFIKDSVTPLFVGVYAGAAAVGYVNWARNLAFAPLMLSQVFARVAFPAFSKLQNDTVLLKETIESSIRMLTLVLFPITLLLMSLGPEITHSIFTDKWIPAINAFYIFCTAPLFMGIALPMFSAILALGNARLMMWITLGLVSIEWGCGIPFIKMFGFTGIALTQPVSYIIFVFIYRRTLIKSTGIKPAIIINIKTSLVSAVAVSLTVFFVKGYLVINLVSIISCITAGLLLFILLVYLLDRKLLKEFVNFASHILPNNKATNNK